MSEDRVLLIENPARLKIDTGRLKIERDSHPPAFVMPEDIDVLCLHHPVITVSTAVLQCLTEAGAMILITDAHHEPCASLYPLKAHARQSLRLRRQIQLESTNLPATLWQQIVRARIKSEATTLRRFRRKGALYLERLVKKVLPDDLSNHEGQAARHYWRHLFDGRFKRVKRGVEDNINSRLNFGYAVLRSTIARQLAAMGLNLGLGLGHQSSENPFNLADDFLEPYRYMVEQRVTQLAKT